MNKPWAAVTIFLGFVIGGYLILGTIARNYPEEATQVYTVKEISPSAEAATSSVFKIGDEATVSNWKWVSIANETPIEQMFAGGPARMGRGEQCGIQFGGVVTVVDVYIGRNLLVEYKAPGSPVGTPCSTGTRFVVGEDEFGSMTARYNEVVSATRAEKELTQRILDKDYYGEEVSAGDWRWVEMVNGDPAPYPNSKFAPEYHSSCAIGRGRLADGGTVRMRGEEGGRVLYEYIARGESAGTSCSTGTLFFEDKKL